MRVSRGPLLLCVGGCWLWFRGAGVSEGGGWSTKGRLAGCQPRAHVPTSPFWGGPPGVGTLSPANHVLVDRPPVSGGQARRRWGLVQKREVGRVSTTCACTNLPFLGRAAARRWHAQPCQPRDCGPISSCWWPGPQKVGVGPEKGEVGRAGLCQPCAGHAGLTLSACPAAARIRALGPNQSTGMPARRSIPDPTLYS